MKMNCFIFIILAIINSVVSQRPEVPEEEDLDVGYYWRGYDRDIPEDALPGGKDKRGKTTYIGQTLHGSSCGSDVVIVTGHIYEAEKQMKYEWGYRTQTASNPIQVLCTRHPEQFEWIETNIVDILNLTDRHLVCGGREKNYTIYVGRVQTDDEIAVGKVLISDLHYMEGFYAIVNGTKLHIKHANQSYEVLAYNPSLSNTRHATSYLIRSSNSVSIKTMNSLILVFTLLTYVSSVISKS
ncbi:hypothetical protein ILUMI_06575 [Ignelater luminosus]|uniref:Uncharacterized protein n=1 Tax=Ignelater luminosus TaxID=2038154 RepID=A0A8K0DA01_IGNLU|nr:hypothetical protein ILUMI_06575 [Ignelater luminosus]